jgi:hypothetical protein
MEERERRRKDTARGAAVAKLAVGPPGICRLYLRVLGQYVCIIGHNWA